MLVKKTWSLRNKFKLTKVPKTPHIEKKPMKRNCWHGNCHECRPFVWVDSQKAQFLNNSRKLWRKWRKSLSVNSSDDWRKKLTSQDSTRQLDSFQKKITQIAQKADTKLARLIKVLKRELNHWKWKTWEAKFQAKTLPISEKLAFKRSMRLSHRRFLFEEKRDKPCQVFGFSTEQLTRFISIYKT